MQKKTHIVFGILMASILLFLLDLPIQYSILVGFSAILADIDWLMDKIWFGEESLLKRFWYKLTKNKGLHRRIFHNIWFAILFSFLFFYISNFNHLVLLSSFIGYISHLLLDSLTYSGVYWLWPYGDEKIFGKRKFYIKGDISTGSITEKVLYTIFLFFGSFFFSLEFYSMFGGVRSLNEKILIFSITTLFSIYLVHKLINLVSVLFSRIFRY